MQLGLCSIALLDMPILDIASLAAEAGLDGIEVTVRRPHLDRDAGPDAARQLGSDIRALGLDVLAYGSYFGSRGRCTQDDAEADVALAEALDAPLLRVWAEPDEDQPGVEPVVDGIRRIAQLARPRGITIVVERHNGSLADTPERIEKLLAAVDEPNVALNYQALDFLPPDDYRSQAEDAHRLMPHARYVHLKNYRTPESGSGNTLPWAPLADGTIDYEPVLKEIAGSGFDGPASIEFLATDARPPAERLAADVEFVRTCLQP